MNEVSLIGTHIYWFFILINISFAIFTTANCKMSEVHISSSICNWGLRSWGPMFISVLLQSVHTVKLSKTARELDGEILVTIKRQAIISPRGLISGKQDHRKKGFLGLQGQSGWCIHLMMGSLLLCYKINRNCVFIINGRKMRLRIVLVTHFLGKARPSSADPKQLIFSSDLP